MPIWERKSNKFRRQWHVPVENKKNRSIGWRASTPLWIMEKQQQNSSSTTLGASFLNSFPMQIENSNHQYRIIYFLSVRESEVQRTSFNIVNVLLFASYDQSLLLHLTFTSFPRIPNNSYICISKFIEFCSVSCKLQLLRPR